MSALLFLGIAVGLSLLGCVILWLRSRQPRSMDAHIQDFARELDALAPGAPRDRPVRRPLRGVDGEPRAPERTTRPERPPERGPRPG